MQYHIQTTPIWEAFARPDGCALCRLQEKTETGLLNLYSGEAVMEPDYRVRVNLHGFCGRHLKQLLSGENKLGLGLQLATRTEYLASVVKCPDTAKGALKLAEKMEETLSGCVICSQLDEVMKRYAYTVAEMFYRESKFPALLEDCGGFCMNHFTQLLGYVSHAFKAAPAYCAALKRIESARLSKVKGDLEAFTRQYDYRAAPAGKEIKNALTNALALLLGCEKN